MVTPMKLYRIGRAIQFDSPRVAPVGTPLISLGPALVAGLLRAEHEKRTTCEPEVQTEIPG